MAGKDDLKGTQADDSKRNSNDDSKGTPKKNKGKLYTDAQIAKFKSDSANMAQGRAEVKAKQEKDALDQELQSYKTRLDALEGERNEDRLAEARGDDDKMRTYQRENTLRTRERQADERDRDLTRREGQVKADRAEVDKDIGVVSIATIAAKHGIDQERLEKLGITDPEQLEKVAEELAAAGKAPETEDEKTAREAREAAGEESLDIDDGETAGGAGTLEALEQANEDFQAGKIDSKKLEEIAKKVKD